MKFLNARQLDEYIESHRSKNGAWKLNVLVCLETVTLLKVVDLAVSERKTDMIEYPPPYRNMFLKVNHHGEIS